MKYRTRRIMAVLALIAGAIGMVVANPNAYEKILAGEFANLTSASENLTPDSENLAPAENSENTGVDASGENRTPASENLAREILNTLAVKGRAPKTGYTREKFYKTWPDVDGCSLRQRIIKREFGDTATLASDQCAVTSGSFVEPYTGEEKTFASKTEIGKNVQIDHVVALSDAWQKGAEYFDDATRYQIATDPLNLLAVDASANQQKSDGDAATWLPKNKSFRCQYIARQIAVKAKYALWVTEAERDAMARVLETCPAQTIPVL